MRALLLTIALLAPALPAFGEDFDRLSFEPPQGWRAQSAGEGDSRQWTIAPLTTQALVRVYPAEPLGERTLEQWSARFADRIDLGRKRLKLWPARERTTPQGLRVVSRLHSSQNPQGLRRICALWAFDVGGGRVQAVSLMALDPRLLLSVSPALERSLNAAKLSAQPAVPEVGEPPPAEPGSSTFTDQGVLGSASVTSVPKSARLKPIPFELTWAQPYSTGGSPAGSLDFGVDPAGSVYLLRTGKLVNTWQRDEKQVWRFKGRKVFEKTNASKETVERYLNASVKPLPERGWRLMEFDALYLDARGHGFLRATAYSVECDLHLAMWEGSPELVAHPGWIAGLARGLKIRRGFARQKLTPTPQGDAWLFVFDYYQKFAPGKLNMAIRVLKRSEEKGWQATTVTPRFDARGTRLPPPTRGDVLGGAPDWRGGWVCYTGSALWRIERGGKAYPLVTFRLRSSSVRIPNLLVQPNGDVWFAVNRRYDRSASVDSLDRTHHFVLIGDRSRWIRVRLGKEGTPELGEISAETLLKAIKARARAKKSTVVDTTKLRWDPSTPGAIAAYEGHHGVLYTLRPTD